MKVGAAMRLLSLGGFSPGVVDSENVTCIKGRRGDWEVTVQGLGRFDQAARIGLVAVRQEGVVGVLFFQRLRDALLYVSEIETLLEMIAEGKRQRKARGKKQEKKQEPESIVKIVSRPLRV